MNCPDSIRSQWAPSFHWLVRTPLRLGFFLSLTLLPHPYVI